MIPFNIPLYIGKEEQLIKAGDFGCYSFHKTKNYHIGEGGAVLVNNDNGVAAVFHYIPLHSLPAGQNFDRFHGKDKYTTKESERLCRLPLYYGLTDEDINTVVKAVFDFYK